MILGKEFARFLKAYSVFISIHTEKEDLFFDLIEEKGSLSEEEHSQLIGRYKFCNSEVGGKVRVEQMIKLIGYLEEREWMKMIPIYRNYCIIFIIRIYSHGGYFD